MLTLHEPLIYPRNENVFESLFLKAWNIHLENELFFTNIFPVNSFNKERAGVVAASFMVFMGSNNGLSFTYMANKLNGSYCNLSRLDSFIATWSIESKKDISNKYSTNYVEIFLTPRKIFADKEKRIDFFKKNISLEDYEIVDELVKWWSTFEAEKIRIWVQKEYETSLNYYLSY